jgi:hypothetical protein
MWGSNRQQGVRQFLCASSAVYCNVIKIRNAAPNHAGMALLPAAGLLLQDKIGPCLDARTGDAESLLNTVAVCFYLLIIVQTLIN